MVFFDPYPAKSFCPEYVSDMGGGGGGLGVRNLPEKTQNFRVSSGSPEKITKLPLSQYSMLGHHRPPSETPFNGTASVNTDSHNGANKRLDSGVTHCQSQHQCHLWRLSSMFEAYCTRK